MACSVSPSTCSWWSRYRGIAPISSFLLAPHRSGLAYCSKGREHGATSEESFPCTRVNKVMKQGRGPIGPRPFSLSSAALLAHQLVLGFIYQPLLFFPLSFFCCSGFLLPCLRHGAYLLHRP